MTVRELKKYYECYRLALLNGNNGRLVANTHKGVEKYLDCEILSLHNRIVTSPSSDVAMPELYAYVRNDDVERIKSELKSK